MIPASQVIFMPQRTIPYSINLIYDDGIILAKYGIEERADSSDYNHFIENDISGTNSGSILVNGPHSTFVVLPVEGTSGDDTMIGTEW